MKEVIIMRGPPGSGKSTHIRKNYRDATVVSADHFFEKVERFQRDPSMDGGPVGERTVYNFEPTKIPEAHQSCLSRFISAIYEDASRIVVDNTNILPWQYETYKILAKEHGYQVVIVEFRPKTVEDIRACIERNVHRVPAEVVTRMCLEFQEDPDASLILSIST